MLFRGDANDFNALTAGQVAPESIRGLDKFISYSWSNYVKSKQYRMFEVCKKYYDNENIDVACKTRTVFERTKEGTVREFESDILTNTKVSHAYYKKLIKQKVGFVFTKMFGLSAKDKEDQRFKEMYDQVKPYLTDKLHRTLKNSAVQGICKGLDWVRAYWDESGNLQFTRVPSEQVKPIWADSEKTELSGLIHCYDIDEFGEDGAITVEHFDYYHPNFKAMYIKDTTNAIVPYIPYGYASNISPYLWGPAETFENGKLVKIEPVPVDLNRIPWICIRYENDFSPLLKRIKGLIDQIDIKISELADSISDTPNSLMLIKNMDGQDPEAFMKNVNTHRTIFVQGDGDAKSLSIPLDIAGTLNMISYLKSTMYDNANGIETASKDTRDTSGTALKLLFGDLDIDVKDWEVELRESMRELIFFILYDINKKTGNDYFDVEYDVNFTHELIINETEQIQNALTLSGIISQETIFAHIPWVQDVEYEVAQLDREKDTEMQRELDFEEKSSEFGTNTSVSTETINTNTNVRGADVSNG